MLYIRLQTNEVVGQHIFNMFILLSLLTHATSDKTKSSQVKVVYSKITTFNQVSF